jgi:hypothetical protein
VQSRSSHISARVHRHTCSQQRPNRRRAMAHREIGDQTLIARGRRDLRPCEEQAIQFPGVGCRARAQKAIQYRYVRLGPTRL